MGFKIFRAIMEVHLTAGKYMKTAEIHGGAFHHEHFQPRGPVAQKHDRRREALLRLRRGHEPLLPGKITFHHTSLGPLGPWDVLTRGVR